MPVMLIQLLTSLFSSYLAKLATKEVAHYVFFEVAKAIVSNTKTKEDDKWLSFLKETVEKK